MQELNTTIAFGKFSALSTTAQKIEEAQQIEADVAAFLEAGGTPKKFESFIDKQEAEHKARIKKWGKTLYDEPAPRKKTAPKKAVAETSGEPAEFVSVAEAAEMLGFSYSWMRNKIMAGNFKHLTVKRIGNAKHFVTAEIEALIPTHHRNNVPPPHNSVKLSIGDVLEFRRLLATNKHTVGELCGRFKISVSTGYRIASGEQYRNIKLND